MNIRVRTTKKGTTFWQLDLGMVEGRRHQKSYTSLEDAEHALARARGTKKRLGEVGLTLAPADMAEFMALRARVVAAGCTLSDAVTYYIKHKAALVKPVLVREMVESFLWAKDEQGAASRTLQTYRSTMRGLARMYPLRMSHELTRDEIERWLGAQGWESRTRNGALGHVRTLMAWGKDQGHLVNDPSAGIATRTEAVEEIGTLSVAQCERLLRAAQGQPRMMGYLVLGLFGGLRRAEIERLTWDAINLKEGTVIVGARISKTRTRRVVDLTANARAWMAAAGDGLRGKSMRVAPANLKELWPEFWPKAGLAVWPNNALRHTFASMHYAAHQDEAKLQAQMGHESARMLHQHYRALKSKTEAAKFWKLKP
jgi:integrase